MSTEQIRDDKTGMIVLLFDAATMAERVGILSGFFQSTPKGYERVFTRNECQLIARALSSKLNIKITNE